MNKKYLSVIKELTGISSSNHLIVDSFKSIKLTKCNVISSGIICITSFIVAKFASESEHTVSFSEDAGDLFLGVQLAIFGSVLAVYSILLAFFSEQFVKRLAALKEKNSTESILLQYIKYFENILCLSFVGICLSVVLKLVCCIITDNYRLFLNNNINILISTILLTLFISFQLRIIYEIKSLIFNTISLFRLSFAYMFTALSEEEDNHK